ncbi:LysM repeat-containing protein [Verrucomicrobium sp. GAS474]|uniref:LysM peptidoglycan-binding domain-containing protein n=1 Tax=Verrucomicrobium sp. GAS474 TaxID=1882831 RepID=UPI00087A8E43|nr:LysM peptidoglycan-binding domain-containing protein [Verrucomicrobium sp. GAS474]SDU07226.1 LysM repeat-containing protein [Verrucomicrobium sp. GAS474]
MIEKAGSLSLVMAFGIALGLTGLPRNAGAEEVRIYRPLGDEAAIPLPAPTPAPAPASEAAAPKALPVVATAKAVPAAVPAPAAPAKTYTVQKGDTLWKISRKCNVTVEALKKANHLPSDQIAVGTALTVPSEGKSLSAASAAPATEEIRRAQPVPVALATPAAPSAAPAVSAPVPTVVPVSSTGEGKIVSSQAELQSRFLAETKALAVKGVGYDQDWTPPGEDEAWDMDCSNTSRYLYRKVTGISMQRTASDQYYDLQQQGRAWDAPLDADGKPDVAWLDTHLRVGDLLFWENTYKPRRDPNITHVMIYLGKNNRNQWLMAGSQSGGGFFNTSGSGPDVYVFKPTASVGGYYKNLGFTHVSGRFVSFGRPLAPLAPKPQVQIASR